MSDEKKKIGFAANPEGINRSGRKKGSRNKSHTIKAQLLMDENTPRAAEILMMIAEGDSVGLGMKGEISATVRANACKTIMDKAIANEKEKVSSDKAAATDSAEDKPKTPQVFSRAK